MVIGNIVVYFFLIGISLWMIAGILEYFGLFEVFSMRIIGKAALFLAAAGFIMPVSDSISGLGLAINLFNLNTFFSMTLYLLFLTLILGGLILIPLILNRKLHIAYDWISLALPLICIFCIQSFFDGISSPLHIGGYLIIVGLLLSLITSLIALLLSFNTKKVITD